MRGGERDAYLARLRERRASATAGGIRFWAFEQEGRPGRFLEFVETSDRAAFDAALAQDTLFSETLDVRLAPTEAETAARAEVFVELTAEPLGTTAPHS